MTKRNLVSVVCALNLVLVACGAGGGEDLTAATSEETDELATDAASADEVPQAIDEVVSSEEVLSAPTTTVAPDESTSSSSTEPLAEAEPRTATEVNQLLGQGMNLGNSLEAPREGDWGAGLDASHFDIIAAAGFDHVRLPVSWAGYAAEEAPYTIPDGVDPTIDDERYDNIWERVDWAIEQAERNDLMIIVNMHHYDEAHVDPAAHRDRMIAIWEQVAERYQDAGDGVLFELFNEPNGAFSEQPELWNELASDLLDAVRETNPTRPVLIGPAGFNGIDYLDELDLPADDYVISTVHLYEPFTFTHQGAEWLPDVPPVGARWSSDVLAFADGISDETWDSRTSTENGQLRIDFERQWAGFSFDFGAEVTPQQISFDVAGNGSLSVRCRTPDNRLIEEDEVIPGEQIAQFTVDLSACPAESTGVSLMNSHPATGPIFLSDVEVCSQARGCEQLFTSADASLRRWVERAAEWSEATGVPVYLGEFGAFANDGQVPIDDRAAWTATVVDEANRQSIPFGYWEFHSDFAAYDLDRGEWNEPLLDALLGE